MNTWLIIVWIWLAFAIGFFMGCIWVSRTVMSYQDIVYKLVMQMKEAGIDPIGEDTEP